MIAITHIYYLWDPQQSLKAYKDSETKMFENCSLNKSPLTTWIHKIAGSSKCNDWGQEREANDLLRITQWIGGRDGSRTMVSCSFLRAHFRVPMSEFWDYQAIKREWYHPPPPTCIHSNRHWALTKPQAAVPVAAEGKVYKTWPMFGG